MLSASIPVISIQTIISKVHLMRYTVHQYSSGEGILLFVFIWILKNVHFYIDIEKCSFLYGY